MASIVGTELDDTLSSTEGDDNLTGRGGDDTYLFSAGFGQDIIRSTGADSTDRDRIVFDDTIERSLVRLTTVFERINDDGSAHLQLDFDGDGSRIQALDFLQNRDGDSIGLLDNGLREVAFADGTVIRLDEGLPLTGNDGSQRMRGSEFDDTIRGEGGNDTLRGGAGSDVLFGGDGNDDVTGGDIFGLFGTEADTLAG
ncbi:MAG: hypothetical protein P1U65_02375, partial [Minwuia sp.]|nr:hypothetical protein [Minwuia sp.]